MKSVKATLHAIGKSALYGLAAGGGLALVAFLFAFLTGSFDAALGLEWARRFLYVIAAVCVIVSGGGLFFAATRASVSRRTRRFSPSSASRGSRGHGRFSPRAPRCSRSAWCSISWPPRFSRAQQLRIRALFGPAIGTRRRG